MRTFTINRLLHVEGQNKVDIENQQVRVIGTQRVIKKFGVK
jgi:hypothetical protein